MKTTLTKVSLNDVFIIEPECIEDERGFFMESYKKKDFVDVGLYKEFVQENHSGSKQHVLRGLHYQNLSAPIEKLVRCTYGEVFDVVVDLRINSKTFGKWFGVTLSAKNKKQLYIPVGFAHGFAVTSAYAEVMYKQTGYYTPSSEETILWSDTNLAIHWPIIKPIISKKDALGKTLKEYIQNPAFT